MSSETTETEMVARLTDAVAHAADYVAQICRSIGGDGFVNPFLTFNLRQALRAASGAAGQLAHARQNPDFLQLRDSLEALSGTVTISGAGARRGLVFAQIGRALDVLVAVSRRLTAARPLGRQVVLAKVDRRQAAVVVS